MAKLDKHRPTERERREAICGKSVTEVRLSERNLLTLLSKLYMKDSARTLYNGVTNTGGVLKLVAETDQDHYNDPAREGNPPGKGHPAAELVHQVVRMIFNGELEEDNEGQKVLYITKEQWERAFGA